MPQVNFNELHEITGLQNKIQDLKDKVLVAKEEVNREEEIYKNLEVSERQTILNNLRQKINLESLENEIFELRKLESSFKENSTKNIHHSLDNFFQSGAFGEFISNLIRSLKAQDPNLVIIAGKDVEKYISGISFKSSSKSDSLQISLDNGAKTYILDLDSLKQKLQEKLIQKKLAV